MMKQEVEMSIKNRQVVDFWLQKLKTVSSTPIFGDKKTPQDTTVKIQEQLDLSFPDELTQKANAVTGGSAAKTFLIFTTALNILAYKYTGQRDILVSTTEFKKEDDPGDSCDVLLFFRTDVENNSIPRGLLNTAVKESNKIHKYRKFRYESFFQRFCSQDTGDRDALYHLGLVYNGFNKNSPLMDEVRLVFITRRQNRGFDLNLRYDARYYRREQVEQLGRHFLNTLGAMLQNLDKPVHAIDIFSETDRRKLLTQFSGRQVQYSPEEKNFISCFQRQVEKTPHSPAIRCHQRTVTYRQLNETANRMARWLIKEAGIQREDLVALVMERSENMAETIIATWKGAAAYVPVDPDFPDDRVKTIIQDARVKLVIYQSGMLHPAVIDRLKSITRVVSLDDLQETLKLKNRQETGINLDIPVSPGNLAYVIYTSGSTGRPKGVMVQHLGMMNHLFAKIADIEITFASVIAQNASQCFDISVWQFFAALPRGGQTVVYTDRWVLNPGEFIKQVGNRGVTILEVVPSYLSMMLDIMEERKLKHLFPQLKYLLVTGETVRPGLVKRWFDQFPAIRIVNAYGPTEASDDITHFKMDRPPEPGSGSIPIGRTVRNFQIYIVDKQMNLCPIGVKGEICVSGIGVGRGYLNQPGLTAERFCLRRTRGNFLLERTKGLVPLVYRTGDLGRWRHDGNIEFFGRKDYQVKIRGYRIELEEIESKLTAVSGIKEAVVIDKEDQTQNKHLYAYVTLKEGAAKKVEEIKKELRTLLPGYMIPTNIVVLDTLPLTPNGKIDRKALPEPMAADISGLEYTPPRSAMEKKLAEIFREVLGIEKVGIHDSFFNLGGDSFKGILIVNKIQDWLKEVVHVTILFLAPTIEELAKKLESYKVMKHVRVDTDAVEKMRRIIPPLPPLPNDRKSIVKNPPAIFILCPPRSGSTLLRVILTGHPKLFAPQEFELMTFNTLQERKQGLSGKFSFYLEGVIRAIMEIKDIDADEAKTIMEELETKNLTCQAFYRVLQEWLEDKILIEKTPAYTLDPEILKRIEEYFDSTWYIHLVRNPYAVIHSFENAKLDQIFKYEHDFPPRELAELVWLISHQNILQFLKRIPRNRQLRVNYEEMVSEPEQVVSGICRFLGVEYDPEIIRVYKNPKKRMTDGIYNESKMLGDVKFFTHSSINTGSVEKWKEKYKTEFLGDEALQLAQTFGYMTGKPYHSRLDSIHAAEKKEYYPLSSAQKRLYIVRQLDLESTSYNQPRVFPLGKDLEIAKLELTLKKLIARHESLRTSFEQIKELPVQKIHPPGRIDFTMDFYEADETEAKKILKNYIRPFDLARSPLMRSGVIRHPDGNHTWIIDTHHIIWDGTSHTILTEDFIALYQGNELEPLRLQYKDFTQWQNQLFVSGEIERQKDYWLSLYADAREIPRLNLPTDFRRPGVFTFEGDCYRIRLEREESLKFKALGARNEVTLFMNMLAALYTLFYKYTGQTDIIIGTGIAGRSHSNLQQIVGMFVNNLAMRNYPSAEQTYQDFLKEVAANCLNAFENQDLQFEELVEQLEVERDPSRNPLFDITMVVQNFRKVGETSPKREIPSRGQVEELPLPETNSNTRGLEFKYLTAKFDMTFFVIEKGDNIHITIEYYTGIFKQETIGRLASHLENVIQTVTKEPSILLKDIEIISSEEKQEILDVFNDTARDYPREKTIPILFAEQVQKCSDRIALVYQEETLTYKELDADANRLAGYLYHKKMVYPGSEEPVGILLSPSLYLVISILGILKAGGVYVPLDPQLPGQRIKFMIQDAGIGTVISGKRHVKLLNRIQWECECFHSYLCIDSENIHAEEEEKSQLMDEELWHHVAENASDDITAGGWISSYTGKPFSRKEMDEYGDNILEKLQPILHQEMRVLEIGCASGISMYRIAPKVALYYGTDLSTVIIRENKKRTREQGLKNIKLAVLAAHEIQQLKKKERNFDLIIINSVIQCFNGHNYLGKVLCNCIDLLADNGYLFIGDIMDLRKKKALVRELVDFKYTDTNREKGYTTKTDFSSELFLSRDYWKDLEAEIEEIHSIEFSDKIYTIENELTKFRYDVLISINKQAGFPGKRQKKKHQEDMCHIPAFDPGKVRFPGKISPDNLAYIIYTSGTTGRPRGVLLGHRGIVNLSTVLADELKIDNRDKIIQFANISFDASIWEFFVTLTNGSVLHLLHEQIINDYDLFHDYLSRHLATIVTFPPIYANHLNIEQLSNLRVLITAGSSPNIDFIKRCRDRQSFQYINAYGPTEDTICSSYWNFNQDEDLNPNTIGPPLTNKKYYIVNNETRSLQPVGIPGELCVSGPGLARGYLNQPELTAEKFIELEVKVEKIEPNKHRSNMAYRSNISHMSYIYKTGDLARWLSNGTVEFLGRIDQQVKLRGFRIELAEIESWLLKHELISDAVVIDRKEDDGDKSLCAYIVGEEALDLSHLKDYLSENLPDYMIPAFFTMIDEIPVTSSGKVDVKALPAPEYTAAARDQYVAPRDETEKKLAAIWSEVLHINKGIISVNSNFFELGGHSLKATILAAKIHKAFNVKLPLAEVFKTPTIRELSQYINSQAEDKFTSLKPVEKKEYYRLSSAQKRLYILQQMESANTGYNMHLIIPLRENIDKERLKNTFKKIILRHESLRTSYRMVDDKPVQQIHEKVDFSIQYFDYYETTAAEPGDMIKNFIHPFDLGKAPLIRVFLLEKIAPPAPSNHKLFIDIHHITTDGTSLEILSGEFGSLYSHTEEELPVLKFHYKDFSQWQNSQKQEELLKQQETYWIKAFSHDDQLPVLNLPTDFQRPSVQSFEGMKVNFIVNERDTRALRDIVMKSGSTLYISLLSIYTILLSKLSGQEDIIVGAPLAGRRHVDLERIVGMFINTLAMRNYPVGQKRFEDFLMEVKDRTLKAFENQEYQFEDLVDRLSLPRDTSRNPLFDVMFNHLNLRDYQDSYDDIREMDEENLILHKKGTSKFDMNLKIIDYGKKLFFNLEYCSKLFRKETINRIIGYFKNIITSILENPGKKIKDIEIISADWKKETLFKFNEDLHTTLTASTIQSMLSRCFKKYGHHIAIEYGAVKLTYEGLERKAAYICHWIIRKQIKTGSLIGIFLTDRIQLITLMIGILKARCVFVPLDDRLPVKRIIAMICATNTRVLFTDIVNLETLQEAAGDIKDNLSTFIIDDSFYKTKGSLPTGKPGICPDGEDNAYIYFTSGTTGTPLAILGKNKGLVHFVDWEIRTFGVNETFKFSQLINPGFDVFLRDIFIPMSAGAAICIPENGGISFDMEEITQWIETRGINFIHFVPSLFKLLLTGNLKKDSFKSLKYITLSGEQIHLPDLKRWYQIKGQTIQLVNIYGPTETTLAKAYYFIKKSDLHRQRIPIKPIKGAKFILLDKNGNICHRGIIGEIYIRTPYRGFGYLNNPGLNKERFIPNPFNGDRTDIIYKTGDLGRQLADGSFEIIGRIDRQVKIRGIRIEIEEIEFRLQSHREIQQVVVVAGKEEKGENYLCAYLVGHKELSVTGLREYLEMYLPGYMIPAYFVWLDQIPLTPNGKIDRRALPAPDARAGKEYIAPRNKIEEKLVEIWEEVLGKEKKIIGIDSNFFELGGHSLKATALVSRVHKELNIKIPLVEIFKTPTIRGLSGYIQGTSVSRDSYAAIEPTEKKEYYPLSSAQERFYIVQQMHIDSSAYNITMFNILGSQVQPERIEQALKKLVNRHESLRTSFELMEEEIVQRVHDTVDFSIEYYEKPGLELREIQKSYAKPFNLAKAPLLRSGIIKLENGEYLLMINMHHIISDGTSNRILKRDFKALYSGNEFLPPLKLQYRDFCFWQNNLLTSGKLREQEEFWLSQFPGKVPVLNLSTDFPRPAIQSFEGDKILFHLEKEITGHLNELVKETGTTLYIVLVALYSILLSKLSRQKDIIIGSPIAGRSHTDLENIIGLLVEAIAIRCYPEGNHSFAQFLAEVKETTLGAYENQQYPHAELLKHVDYKEDPGRNPLFDAILLFTNIESLDKKAVTNVKLETPETPEDNQKNFIGSSKADLTLMAMEHTDGIFLNLEYCTALFKRETAVSFTLLFKEIAAAVGKNKKIKLKDIKISHDLDKANSGVYDDDESQFEF